MIVPRCFNAQKGDRVVRVERDNKPLARIGDIGTITDTNYVDKYCPSAENHPRWGSLILCKFDHGGEGPCYSGLFMLLSDFEAAQKV